MSYEPLHHKYRPQTFAELVGQEAIATTLTNAIRLAKIAPAYLFTGPRGTGKTSSARILAKSLNCLKSDKPTSQPCGVCDVCKGITNGATLDVIEIDAASNTGVDHIRELIERAQFAPVQCRYKVYVIDECLTGDSLVQTSEGLIRIDDPNIKGKKVQSYNDFSGAWEFKKVVRWLDQGERQTLVIKTTNREIRCTGNHLIRTEQGWIAAKDVKEGAQILSPVNVDAEPSFTNLGRMDAIQSHQWITSLEIVESVKVGGVERVYDIEVEDNHNFVANGLCLHNCHMLSTAAFNSLLKTLEEPPSRVVFVLATTDPQRVLPTIISRCQRFDYRRIPLDAMVAHLRKIATIENINISDQAVQLVAQVAQGGLRDAESLLDQLSLLSGMVTVERVWDLVGSCSEPDLMALLAGVAQNDPEAVLDRARQLMDRGREPLTVLQNLAGFYRDLLIAKTVPSRNDLVAITPATWKDLCEEALLWDVPTILRGQQHLKDSEVQIKNSTQPRLWLEVTLLGLLPDANKAQHTKSVPHTTQPQPPAVRPAPVNHVAVNNVNENWKKPPLPEQVAPIAEVEPSPPVSQPLSVENYTLETPREQVWQEVLAHLQPMSIRALLRQMCHLIEFDGAVARIGITSQTWYKKVQSHLPNISAAFQETFKREVQVSLELATPTQTKTASVDEPRGRSPLPPASPEFQPAAQEESTAPKVSESPTVGVATYTPTNAAERDEDEVTISAQRLADFFKGEVVRRLDPAKAERATTNSLPPITTKADTLDDAEPDVDDAEEDF